MFAVEHTGDAGQEEQHEQPSIRGDYAEPHDGYRYREQHRGPRMPSRLPALTAMRITGFEAQRGHACLVVK
jgi:hypothetical protein